MSSNDKAYSWGYTLPIAMATLAPTNFQYTPDIQGAKMTQTGTFEARAGAGTATALPFDERLIDAKLEAVEARTETKFAQLMGELKAISLSVGHLTTQLAEVKADVAGVKADVGGVKDATAGVKWNILATGIAVGALILGLFAYGAQMIELATGLVGVAK